MSGVLPGPIVTLYISGAHTEGGVPLGFPTLPHKFENYDVMITSMV